MEEKQLEDFLPDKNTSYIKKFNNSKINSKINEEQVRLISKLADTDIEPLVRCRAAEFLGITNTKDPRPAIRQALKMSSMAVETNLILIHL